MLGGYDDQFSMKGTTDTYTTRTYLILSCSFERTKRKSIIESYNVSHRDKSKNQRENLLGQMIDCLV